METKEDIIRSISGLFESNLSDPNRKSLIGAKVDKILEKYFNRISPIQLASALLTKYGSSLFNKKNKVTQTIIYRLDNDEVRSLATKLEIGDIENQLNYELVIEKITKPQNLNIFIEHFNLPRFFLKKEEKKYLPVSEKIPSEYGQKIESRGYPHDYQNFVKLELLEKIRNTAGSFSGLVVMPTGSGKTRTAVEFMIDFIRVSKEANILWLVEKPELAEQALNSFKELWVLRGDRNLFVHRCFGNLNPSLDFSSGINIVFGGFDKLNSIRSGNDPFYNNLRLSLDLLIIDEAHFSLADTYESLISDISRMSLKLKKIGLTATPLRAEDNEFYGLRQYFDNRIIDFKNLGPQVGEDPIGYLQDNNYLAKLDIEYLSIEENEIFEYSRSLNDKVIERIKIGLSEGKQIIVFAMSKNHAIALNILLNHEGIISECIIGDTLGMDRQDFFKDFSNRKINVLVNYDILSTGIDLPVVDEIYLLRRFGQYTTAMQVLGRALRGKKNGGNFRNGVISIKTNNEIIQDESSLYNLIKNMY